MAKGGARLGAGRPRKPLAHHVLAGTYRRDRHGELPPNVLQMPRSRSWGPSEVDWKALGPGGHRFVTEWLSEYDDLSLAEGRLLLEAGHATDVLAAVRQVQRSGLTLKEHVSLNRIEQQWARLLANLIAQLQRGTS